VKQHQHAQQDSFSSIYAHRKISGIFFSKTMRNRMTAASRTKQNEYNCDGFISKMLSSFHFFI